MLVGIESLMLNLYMVIDKMLGKDEPSSRDGVLFKLNNVSITIETLSFLSVMISNGKHKANIGNETFIENFVVSNVHDSSFPVDQDRYFRRLRTQMFNILQAGGMKTDKPLSKFVLKNFTKESLSRWMNRVSGSCPESIEPKRDAAQIAIIVSKYLEGQIKDYNSLMNFVKPSKRRLRKRESIDYTPQPPLEIEPNECIICEYYHVFGKQPINLIRAYEIRKNKKNQNRTPRVTT